MQFRTGVCLGLLTLAACGGDNAAPEKQLVKEGGGQGRTINGQVFTLAFNPESTFVGVAGATITVLQTSADSGDTSGVHPDSMVPLMNRGRPLFGDTSWIDTIPGDTVVGPPVDTLQPPPPPGGCNLVGQQVATAVSDADGHFTIPGLSGGTYQLIMVPPTGYLGNSYCFADLRFQQSIDVQIYAPPAPDSTGHPSD